MINSAIHFCLLVTFTLTSPLSAQALPESTWQPQKVREVGTITPLETFNPVLDIAVADLDRDGEQEIGILRRSGDYPLSLDIREIDPFVYSRASRKVTMYRRSDNYRDYHLNPIHNGDDRRWAIYRIEGRRAYFDLFDDRLIPIDTLETIQGRDITEDGFWKGYPQDFYAADINGDGRKDLVCVFNTGSDERPRSLLAYDMQRKKIIRERRFAPMVSGMQAADLDGDDNPEFIISLAGASDGPEVSPFARDSSYLAVLDSEFNIIKSWPFGGESSWVSTVLKDVNADGLPDIILNTLQRMETDDNRSIIRIIDGKTLTVITERTSSNPQGYAHLTLDNGCGPFECRFITIDDGRAELSLFTYNNNTQRIKPGGLIRTPFNLQYIFQTDFNDDGNTEWFFTNVGDPYSLWITDSSLRPIGRVPLNGRVWCMFRLISSHPQTTSFILLEGDKLSRLDIDPTDLYPPPLMLLRFGRLTTEMTLTHFLIVIIILGCLAIVFILLRYQKQRLLASPLPKSERIGELLISDRDIILRHNHAFAEQTGWNSGLPDRAAVSLLAEKPETRPLAELYHMFRKSGKDTMQREVPISSGSSARNIGCELYRCHHLKRPEWIQILTVDLSETTQTERLRSWAGLAQRVAHKTKTPLGTILLALQRLQRAYNKETPEHAESYDHYLQPALLEIENVRGQINSFVKLARTREAVPRHIDLEDHLGDFIDTYRQNVPSGVSLRFEQCGRQAPVHIDPEQFNEALTNILDNAVTAMQGEGTITVTLAHAAHPLDEYTDSSQAVIEIHDDGSGIPEDILARLFTPGVTTSSHGSGLGLVIARNIIERFHGELSISSRENLGTTVQIRIPLSNGQDTP